MKSSSIDQTLTSCLSLSSWWWESCRPLNCQRWMWEAAQILMLNCICCQTKRRSLRLKFIGRLLSPASMRPSHLRWLKEKTQLFIIVFKSPQHSFVMFFLAVHVVKGGVHWAGGKDAGDDRVRLWPLLKTRRHWGCEDPHEQRGLQPVAAGVEGSAEGWEGGGVRGLGGMERI